jgi:CheY-like chemotaxis protein
VRRREVQRERLDINDVVRETLAMFEGQARLRGVPLTVDLGEGLPPISADLIEIEQVLLNLLQNALDVMDGRPDKARGITVTTRRSVENADSVEVAVRDHGTGLTPEVQAHLFDPFFTTKPQGLGLGLSICRTIVESHGGHLWATNEPDGGLSMRFALPILAEDSPHERPTPRPRPSAPLILIVDDDEAMRSSMAFLFASIGLAAQTYPDAASFLAALPPAEQLRPGALVLDVRMPGMSGLELQRLLAERQFPLPILIVTGHGDVPMAVQALKAGPTTSSRSPSRSSTCWTWWARPSGLAGGAGPAEPAALRQRAPGPPGPARARGARRHPGGQAQQGHRLRAGAVGQDGGGLPRLHHAEDGGGLAGRAGDDGGQGQA